MPKSIRLSDVLDEHAARHRRNHVDKAELEVLLGAGAAQLATNSETTAQNIAYENALSDAQNGQGCLAGVAQQFPASYRADVASERFESAGRGA